MVPHLKRFVKYFHSRVTKVPNIPFEIAMFTMWIQPKLILMLWIAIWLCSTNFTNALTNFHTQQCVRTRAHKWCWESQINRACVAFEGCSVRTISTARVEFEMYPAFEIDICSNLILQPHLFPLWLPWPNIVEFGKDLERKVSAESVLTKFSFHLSIFLPAAFKTQV